MAEPTAPKSEEKAPSPPAPDKKEPRPPERKVLLILVDGLIPESIAEAETPALDLLIREGVLSLEALAESTAISGSGWSSFLTGVHWEKHGVPDNKFSSPRYESYPHFFQRLKEARPDARTASANTWKPIEELLVKPTKPDINIFFDYYEYDDDFFDEESADRLAAEALAEHLRQDDIDAAVALFGELDGVGHSDGNEHYDPKDPLYLAMLERVDALIDLLLSAIKARPTYSQEDWLVIVSADHSGSRGKGHRADIPSHRIIPLIVSGPSAYKAAFGRTLETVDIVPTALSHLGVTIQPAWGLDGAPIEFPAQEP